MNRETLRHFAVGAAVTVVAMALYSALYWAVVGGVLK